MADGPQLLQPSLTRLSEQADATRPGHMAKPAPMAGFRARAKLAQFLHFSRGAAALAAGALVAMGCVFPTALQGQEEEPNHQPLITGGDPDFTANPVVRSMDATLTLGVFATDEDVDDHLKARLYYKNGSSFILEGETPLPNVTRDSPRRAGTFAPVQLCLLLQPFPEREKLLYVYVSDTAFGEDFDPARLAATGPFPPADGHFDYKYWILICQ